MANKSMWLKRALPWMVLMFCLYSFFTSFALGLVLALSIGTIFYLVEKVKSGMMTELHGAVIWAIIVFVLGLFLQENILSIIFITILSFVLFIGVVRIDIWADGIIKKLESKRKKEE